jgi:hypothetical protein
MTSGETPYGFMELWHPISSTCPAQDRSTETTQTAVARKIERPNFYLDPLSILPVPPPLETSPLTVCEVEIKLSLPIQSWLFLLAQIVLFFVDFPFLY